jgi:lipid-A-disaccharide synthase
VRNWLKRAGGERAELGSSKSFILDVQVSQGNSGDCLAAADAGLIKSGTSTLEAGLMGCPHAVVYKPSRFTEWIFKAFVRYRGPVGLVNLVDGGYEPGKPLLAREILMDKVTVGNLADEIIALLTDEPYRARLHEGLARLREKVTSGAESPSRLAAEAVLAEFKGLGK